jgi:adenosyl cobinamide kinase/adenosyl cobinamide phosphate guanylyltransferase
LILLLGGARSGKSALAVDLAQRGGAQVRFVATAQGDDDEMVASITHHRLHRPENWVTVEAPIDLVPAVRSTPGGDTILIDCITLWISQLMVDHDDEEIAARVDDLVTALEAHDGEVIVISNEVGFGLVPMDPVGRRFRDLQGRVNQTLARAATDTYLVVAGKTLRLDSDDVV